MVRPVREEGGAVITIPRITGELVRLKQTNAGAATERVPVPIDVELAVLEQYPPEMRRAFNEAAIKVNCLAFVEYYNWAIFQGYGPGRVVAKLRETEANEIAVFAGQHLGRYRSALPHVAAQATIQRYGALGPSRHPPQRFGAPVIRPTKKRRFRVYRPSVIEKTA